MLPNSVVTLFALIVNELSQAFCCLKTASLLANQIREFVDVSFFFWGGGAKCSSSSCEIRTIVSKFIYDSTFL